MLKLTETENYLPDIINSFIVAAASKDKPFRPNPAYSLISPSAAVVTGASLALFLDSSLHWGEYNLPKTEQICSEFIESLHHQSFVVPAQIEKVYDFFEKHHYVHAQKGYDSLFDNTALTVCDNSIINFIELYSTATIKLPEKDDLSVLHDIYIFDYAGEEEQFIQNNAHLTHFLVDAMTHITRICGADIDVKLNYNRDNEEDFETLFIIIQTGLSADKNISMLDRVDNEWWLKVDYDVRKVLSIDVDS